MKPAWMHSRTAGAAGALAALAVGMLASAAPAQDLESAIQESYPTNLVLLREATESSVAQLFIGFTAPVGATLLVEPEGDNPANWFVENYLLAHLTRDGYRAYLNEPSARPETGKASPAARTGPASRRRPASLSDAMTAGGDSAVVADSTGAAPAGADSTDASASGKPSGGEPGGTKPASRSATAGEPAGGTGSAGGPAERPDYTLRYRVVHFEISYPKSYRTSPLGSRKVQRRVSVSIVASLVRGLRENVEWVNDGSVERLDVVPASKLSLLEGTDFPFTQPTLETRGLSSLVEPALVTGIVAGLIYLFYTNQD